MHHHLSIEDDVDFKSLHRFLTGRAVGYVAPAAADWPRPCRRLQGLYGARRDLRHARRREHRRGRARRARAAAEPRGGRPSTHDVFVTSRAFKRFTFPRYALLDHVPFDEALRRQYRGVAIEDAWRPYFAVATVLDGSGQGPYLLRRGPFWKAVRASGSLPAVLPPVFTDDGRMLVDGGVIENIPLQSMKMLKAGPNLVVHFGLRTMPQRFQVDYMDIPGRWSLIRRMLTPSGRRSLPAVPNPIAVLQRCLVMHQASTSCRSARSISCSPCRRFQARISWISTATPNCSRRPITGVARASTSWRRRATRHWRRCWGQDTERSDPVNDRPRHQAAARAVRMSSSACPASSLPS